MKVVQVLAAVALGVSAQDLTCASKCSSDALTCTSSAGLDFNKLAACTTATTKCVAACTGGTTPSTEPTGAAGCSLNCASAGATCVANGGFDLTKIAACSTTVQQCVAACGGTVPSLPPACLTCSSDISACVSAAGTDLTKIIACAQKGGECGILCAGGTAVPVLPIPMLPPATVTGTCGSACVKTSLSCTTQAAGDVTKLMACSSQAAKCAFECVKSLIPTNTLSDLGKCGLQCQATSCAAASDVVACAQTALACSTKCVADTTGAVNLPSGECPAACTQQMITCGKSATDLTAIKACAASGATCMKSCANVPPLPSISLPSATCLTACADIGEKCATSDGMTVDKMVACGTDGMSCVNKCNSEARVSSDPGVPTAGNVPDTGAASMATPASFLVAVLGAFIMA